MKTLCITGSVQSRLDPFAESLKQAGASAALSAHTDLNLSMADWHRQVLALQKEHEQLPATWSPGLEWEQLAREIFLANHNQPLWYWSDTDSTLLLDFWSDLDPNIVFLLLHVSPHEALMNAIEHGADTLEALQYTLNEWYKRTRQMLRFHLRHPARSMLLDNSDVLGQVGAYIDVLAQRWQLPLETIGIEQKWQNDPCSLMFYLIDKLLQNQPQALALHHEVQACLFLINDSEEPVSIPELGDVVSDYLGARLLFQVGQADNDTLRQTLKIAQSQLADTSLALQDRQAQLVNLETNHRQLQAQGEQYRQELSKTRSSLENSEQESQRLLGQLHRTQNALEKLTLEEQHKTQHLASLSAEKNVLLSQLDIASKEKTALAATHNVLIEEKAVLTAAHDKQIKLANERQNQIGMLAKEKTDLIASRDALTKEKAALAAAHDEQVKLTSGRKAQLDALAKEKTALATARDEQAKLANERKVQIDTLAKEKAELVVIRDRLSKEKNNLAITRDEHAKLANKRQVQLEALSKEAAELIATRDDLAKEKTHLSAVHDEQVKLINEHRLRIDALINEKSNLAAAYSEQTKLLDEHKVRIDTLLREKAELVAAHYKLHKEKANLVVAHDTGLKAPPSAETVQKQLKALSTEKITLQANLDALTKEHKQQRSKLEESENENQQLLIQLHQTQEELERCLLRYQANQAQLGEQQTRLQKMLQRHPDYWDFNTLEINLLESDDSQQIAQWRLTGLYIGGRLIPEIRFKTCLANGLAGIIIQRTEGISSSAPLLRWPNGFASAEELPCIPTRGSATQGNNAALSGLSTSDWDTLQRLVKQLARLLAQPIENRLPEQLNSTALRSGLLAFAKTLAKWPKVLRYDSIQLQETLCNQGYERLGIGLDNLCLGHRHWPAFDYRLATVDIEPHSFGQNPRLEFPDGNSRNVLQNWFVESTDSHGPRLELRFARPNAMDTHVWNALSQNDQQLIHALIKTLPLQLEELEQAYPAASRPWQDWQAMAGMLRDTLRDILIRTTALRGTPAGIEE